MTVASRARPLLAPVAVLAGVAVAAVYVSAVDPNESGHYPTCPFLWLTGRYCPGCGSLRMVHALTHGHVAAGFGRNPLAFVMLPVFGYLWVRWFAFARAGAPMRSRLFGPSVVWPFIAVVLIFWITRNLPFGRFLAP